MQALLIISSILFILSLIFFSLSKAGGSWLVLSSSWLFFKFWNYCIIWFISSLSRIWLATIMLSSSWVFMGSFVFGCSPSSTMLLGASDFLWLELSWRSKMGLWCCTNGVSSMLEGFSIVMGVTSLELELLAWVSDFSSFCSLPSNLDQILP